MWPTAATCSRRARSRSPTTRRSYGTTNRSERPTSARRRTRWLDAALVLALVGIVVAAVVNVVVEGPAPEQASTPATAAETGASERGGTAPAPLPSLLPLPGELREEGGRLWWTGEDCRVAFLDLASAAVTRVPGKHCRVWPSPDGTKLVGVTENRADALDGRGLELIVPGDGEGRVVRHRPGFLGAEVAWSPDSASFAVCFGTRGGVVTQVFAAGGSRTDTEGACFPAFTAEGRLAVAAGDPIELELDGRPILGAREIERIVGAVPKGATRAVSALAADGGRLAVSLVGVSETRLLPTASAVAVLDEGGRLAFDARLFPRNTLPAALGLAPDGGALWYRDVGNDRAVILSIPGARRLSYFPAAWFAWSPDGRYLAAARGNAIVLLTWPDEVVVAKIPVSATQVAWTQSPGQ